MGTGLPDREGITDLLRQWQAEDPCAPDRLMPFVHGELRRIARVHMRGERADNVLQPTALVNEVCLRLWARRTLGRES